MTCRTMLVSRVSQFGKCVQVIGLENRGLVNVLAAERKPCRVKKHELADCYPNRDEINPIHVIRARYMVHGNEKRGLFTGVLWGS